MLLPSRVEGRTLGLRGPDPARGPEVARLCSRPCEQQTVFNYLLLLIITKKNYISVYTIIIMNILSPQ